MGRGIIAWEHGYEKNVGSRDIMVYAPSDVEPRPELHPCDGCDSEAAGCMQALNAIIDQDNCSETAVPWGQLSSRQKRFAHALAVAADACKWLKEEVSRRDSFLARAGKRHELAGKCLLEPIFNGDGSPPVRFTLLNTDEQTLRAYAVTPVPGDRAGEEILEIGSRTITTHLLTEVN